MFSEQLRRWLLQRVATVVTALADAAQLVETRQANRRVRRAWRDGRSAQCAYLFAQHQRRRLQRRAEIRTLVEGPVTAALKVRRG
ncbi:MAG: hypothetical protein KDA44_12725 [Planctomycetales bacterium]|nr:hypothetical protein [Planctomycetales bacterium]